jgi:DNA-directed RNA polymerase specialized sigma24 family protein
MGESQKQSKDPRWIEDYQRVADILNGDTATWHAFVEEYADKVLATALSWCRPGCLGACPFEGRRPEGLVRIFLGLTQDCDEASDAFEFIFRTIKQKCLRVYRGECQLSSFLFPLFHPIRERDRSSSGTRYGYEQLFSDFLRERYDGRVRAPKSVKRLGQFEAKVFVQICYGRDDDAIAFHLYLSLDEAARLPELRTRIEEVLRKEGWDHYWKALGHRQIDHEVTFTDLRAKQEEEEEEEADIEVADPNANTEEEALAGIIVKEVIGQLPMLECAVLRLHFRNGRTAEEIGAVIGMERRQVYAFLDAALRHLREAFQGVDVSPSAAAKSLMQALADWNE